MKALVFSDLHGKRDSSLFLLERLEGEKPDLLILLGDILYHGPRNDVPAGYNPKGVIEDLSKIKCPIISVRGNCEAEVDQMVLDFPILENYDTVINNISVHLEHGHHLDSYVGNAKIILYGHTHIPCCEDKNSQIYINPGSITIPKNNSKRGYGVWEDNKVTLYTIDDEVVASYTY